MALKIPAIPGIEDLSEMLALVGNSPLYKERVQTLGDLYTKLSEQLSLYAEVEDIQAAKGQVEALKEEARLLHLQSVKVLQDSQEQARTDLSQISKRRQELDEMLEGARLRQSREEDRLAQKDALLAKKEADLDRAKAFYDSSLKDVEKAAAANAALTKELESKLAKLREIAV